MDPSEAADGDGFRLGYVPGVTPAKWARVWQERHPGTSLHLVRISAADAESALLRGEVDAALLRPPVNRDLLHAIVLYTEEPVVVVSRDHVLAALDADEPADPHDLVDDVLLQPADDVLAWAGRPGAADAAIPPPGRAPAQVPETTPDAIALAAAGVGIVVVPRSLARLHHRKDVTARALTGAPGAPVALAWVIEREDDRIEDLVGIVRGRTVNSTRGRSQQSEPERPTVNTAAHSKGTRRPSRPSRNRQARRR